MTQLSYRLFGLSNVDVAGRFFVIAAVNELVLRGDTRKFNDTMKEEIGIMASKRSKTTKKSDDVYWQNVYVPVEIKRRIAEAGSNDVQDYCAGLCLLLGVATSVLVRKEADGTYKAFAFWPHVLDSTITCALSQQATKPENALFALVWAWVSELDAGKAVEVDKLEDDEADFIF